MRELTYLLAEYCRSENKEYLLAEWDAEANGILISDTVT